jgi:hypothetical protein
MKRIAVALVIALSLLFAGDKDKDKKEKPAQVWIKKADKKKEFESQAKEVQAKKQEALDFVKKMDDAMLILQGKYSVYDDPLMPDSIPAKPDTTIKK